MRIYHDLSHRSTCLDTGFERPSIFVSFFVRIEITRADRRKKWVPGTNHHHITLYYDTTFIHYIPLYYHTAFYYCIDLALFAEGGGPMPRRHLERLGVGAVPGNPPVPILDLP